MKKMIKLFAAAMLSAPMAIAAQAADKPASHDGVMTEKLGEEVPTMTSDEKPMEKSDAPDAQTYTGKVGESVPNMTSPENGKETRKN